jgi:hypothetical protein
VTRKCCVETANIFHLSIPLQAFFPFAIIMVLVYPVGIPAMYAVLLFGHRKLLADKDAMEREAAHNFPKTGHIVFLIEAYKACTCTILMFQCCH